MYPNFALSDNITWRCNQITIFKMASLRHIEFVMTSSFCTRELLKSNIVLNFQVDSLSWANVNALVVNGVRCENSILWPPKGISLCASASFKLLSVKIRLGVWPVCWSEKKINSHIKKVMFHPFAQKTSANGFSPNLVWQVASMR